MERLGWILGLYPLIYQEELILHNEAKSWMKRAKRPPVISIMAENARLLISRPLTYFSVLFQVLFGNFSSLKFLSRAAFVFPKAVWMAHQMSAEKITHIHSHYATHPALAAWIINQLTGIPYGITVHAHDIFVDRSMLSRKLLDADYIIAISEFNKKFLIEHYGQWVAEKIRIIHCGIYPDEYVSELLPIKPSERFELISIGSLRPYKGFSYLLDACSLLKQSGLDFRCRIIGGGELRSSLDAQIKDLDIGDRVDMVGAKNQTEVAELLKTANCYVQPSVITSTGKMEGIPVSLMEAMATCLPSIATAISGIPELVRHGETGWLVSPESPQELADAIMYVRDNPTEAKRCAESGMKFVLEEFNILRTTGLLSDLFREKFKDTNLWK